MQEGEKLLQEEVKEQKAGGREKAWKEFEREKAGKRATVEKEQKRAKDEQIEGKGKTKWGQCDSLHHKTYILLEVK